MADQSLIRDLLIFAVVALGGILAIFRLLGFPWCVVKQLFLRGLLISFFVGGGIAISRMVPPVPSPPPPPPTYLVHNGSSLARSVNRIILDGECKIGPPMTSLPSDGKELEVGDAMAVYTNDSGSEIRLYIKGDRREPTSDLLLTDDFIDNHVTILLRSKIIYEKVGSYVEEVVGQPWGSRVRDAYRRIISPILILRKDRTCYKVPDIIDDPPKRTSSRNDSFDDFYRRLNACGIVNCAHWTEAILILQD
jgi:hypothetical protein